MQIAFSFDNRKIAARGANKEDIYRMLKRSFAKKNLPCTSDGDILAFSGTGKSEDYGNIWAIIFALIDCDWFTDCASYCAFTEDGETEDILSQIPRAKRIMASA